MSDNELIKLLEIVKSVAIVPYPFAKGSDCDGGLVLTLGQIAGMATKAMTEYKPSIEPAR